MFSPKLAKLALVGGVTLLVGVMSLLGGNSAPAGESEEPGGQLPGQVTISAATEVLIYSNCPVCAQQNQLEPERFTSLARNWLGLTQEGLEEYLLRNFHSPTIQQFGRETVVVDVVERCSECESQWPQEGIISIHNGRLAIFTVEGALVEVLNENVPADWYQELEEGIPYSTLEEGRQWIENLIS